MPPVTIPYYAPVEAVPAPLPTTDAIKTSTDILSTQIARRVVEVGEHFVVKYGRQVNLTEGQNMVYLARTTSISLPTVYALFHDPVDQFKYIIMQRVPGRTLDTLWAELSRREKENISHQLQSTLDELRRLASPAGYCSVFNGPLLDGLFWTGFEDTTLGLEGPFESETELNAAIVKKCRSSDILKGKANFYERTLPFVLRDHQPVFSHGDIQRKNITVQMGSTPADPASVTLIDWEVFGWYPSYWDYARAVFACGRFKDD